MLPGFKPLVQALFCPFYYCWCRLLHYGEDKCSPFFGRCCRRYAAHFTAVGPAFYNTAGVNAAAALRLLGTSTSLHSEIGVRVVLPILLLLVPHFTLRRG